jgi:hypothetical protein
MDFLGGNEHLRKQKSKVLDASPVCSEGGEVMEAIFQQAKFDEKLDEKRCLDVFKEVRARLQRNHLSSTNTCSRCGHYRFGIINAWKMIYGQKLHK